MSQSYYNRIKGMAGLVDQGQMMNPGQGVREITPAKELTKAKADYEAAVELMKGAINGISVRRDEGRKKGYMSTLEGIHNYVQKEIMRKHTLNDQTALFQEGLTKINELKLSVDAYKNDIGQEIVSVKGYQEADARLDKIIQECIGFVSECHIEFLNQFVNTFSGIVTSIMNSNTNKRFIVYDTNALRIATEFDRYKLQVDTLEGFWRSFLSLMRSRTIIERSNNIINNIREYTTLEMALLRKYPLRLSREDFAAIIRANRIDTRPYDDYFIMAGPYDWIRFRTLLDAGEAIPNFRLEEMLGIIGGVNLTRVFLDGLDGRLEHAIRWLTWLKTLKSILEEADGKIVKSEEELEAMRVFEKLLNESVLSTCELKTHFKQTIMEQEALLRRMKLLKVQRFNYDVIDEANMVIVNPIPRWHLFETIRNEFNEKYRAYEAMNEQKKLIEDHARIFGQISNHTRRITDRLSASLRASKTPWAKNYYEKNTDTLKSIVDSLKVVTNLTTMQDLENINRAGEEALSAIIILDDTVTNGDQRTVINSYGTFTENIKEEISKYIDKNGIGMVAFFFIRAMSRDKELNLYVNGFIERATAYRRRIYINIPQTKMIQDAYQLYSALKTELIEFVDNDLSTMIENVGLFERMITVHRSNVTMCEKIWETDPGGVTGLFSVMKTEPYKDFEIRIKETEKAIRDGLDIDLKLDEFKNCMKDEMKVKALVNAAILKEAKLKVIESDLKKLALTDLTYDIIPEKYRRGTVKKDFETKKPPYEFSVPL